MTVILSSITLGEDRISFMLIALDEAESTLDRKFTRAYSGLMDITLWVHVLHIWIYLTNILNFTENWIAVVWNICIENPLNVIHRTVRHVPIRCT